MPSGVHNNAYVLLCALLSIALSIYSPFHSYAALLVASRLHNFSRSVREVAKVVKLSEGTIRKRLGDFKDTPSSRLTIDEFLNVDLEQEHDPPCYLEAKRRAKVQLSLSLHV